MLNRKILFLVVAAVHLAAAPRLASAAIMTMQLGTSGPFDAFSDDSNAASFGQYFVFDLDATTAIDIDINRTAAPPDLISVLFSGDITGEDPNQLSPDGLINGFLDADIGDQLGPLTILDREDDTENDPFGGPFGDPRFTNTLDAGTYTVLVAALAPELSGVPAGQFTITSNVGAAVPEPSTAMGALILLAGGSIFRRRRDRTSRA